MNYESEQIRDRPKVGAGCADEVWERGALPHGESDLTSCCVSDMSLPGGHSGGHRGNSNRAVQERFLMSLGILTNVAATYAQNNLNQTQGSLQTVLQQLSSGSRINSGADDAAGLSIADGLRANEAALTQSAKTRRTVLACCRLPMGRFRR